MKKKPRYHTKITIEFGKKIIELLRHAHIFSHTTRLVFFSSFLANCGILAWGLLSPLCHLFREWKTITLVLNFVKASISRSVATKTWGFKQYFFLYQNQSIVCSTTIIYHSLSSNPLKKVCITFQKYYIFKKFYLWENSQVHMHLPKYIFLDPWPSWQLVCNIYRSISFGWASWVPHYYLHAVFVLSDY